MSDPLPSAFLSGHWLSHTTGTNSRDPHLGKGWKIRVFEGAYPEIYTSCGVGAW